MAKKKREKTELKPIDEEAEKVRRYLRLHADSVEEMEELPPVRIGEILTPEENEEEGKKRAMSRTNEPDIDTLIERDEIVQEGQWESMPTERKLPWGWAVLVACIFAGGILWSLWAVNRSEKKQELLVDQTERIIEDAQQEEEDAERLVDAIEAGVHGFFGSKSKDDMLRFVRQPERIAPLIDNYYGEAPVIPVGLKKFRGLAPLTIGNRASFWIASCELESNEAVEILVEAVGPGEAKVDWETYVNYQPMPWDEFARSRPGGYTGDFRVYVEPDNYYSHEFSDSGVFTSYRITALRGDETLTGYVPRGEELDKEITDLIMRNGGGATPLILRLYVPNNLESKRGVVVEKLVCPRWVYVGNPENGDP